MIMDFLRDMCCVFFGHNYGRPIFCYSISNTTTSYTVEMYRMRYCRRCHYISSICIERCEHYVWNPAFCAEKEAERLREKGYITIAEGYEKLSKEEEERGNK